MKCKNCGNDDGANNMFSPETGNEHFETLEYEISNSNCDDYDFYARYRCKICGHIVLVSQ